MVKYGNVGIAVRTGRVVRQKMIKRQDLQNNRDKIYLFGDNCRRIGMGGQAKEMRGEPNAVGIRTKKAPNHFMSALFTMEDWENDKEILMEMIDEDFARIPRGTVVVIPEDGLGTGHAKLNKYCPPMLEYIENKIRELSIDSI